MKRASGAMLAIATLALIALVVKWESDELSSPGPLHPSHAAVGELQGADGCTACHGDHERDLSASCIVCHEDIGVQLRGHGLHGAFADRACGSCHVEHRGELVELVGAHAFARAGVGDRDRYGHEHVEGFSLSGAHRSLPCARCHEHADAQPIPSGTKRFLGLTQACRDCHEDPHAGDLGPDCARCHGQERPFDLAAEFEHDPRFPLAGAHAEVACRRCHEPGTLRLDARRATVRACAECHENPHAEPLASTGSGRLRIADARNCAACHDTVSFDRVEVSAGDHARFAFALEGAHAAVSCITCHGGGGRPAAWRGPAPASSDCAACHVAPHRRWVAAFECGTCHEFDDESFHLPDARIDPAHHGAAGFELTAPHDVTSCVSCHRGTTFEQRYPGRDANDCAACHEDPHAGQFGERSCTLCHATTRFTPSTFDAIAHAHTGFPLDGSHDAVTCHACHEEVELRPGVRARRFAGTASTCASCHSDPHSGRFGAVGCEHCHATTGFSDVVWRADEHREWTGFALRGAHREAACRACHGRPFAPAPSGCADCHTDVHAGQFARDGRTDCSRCHSDAHGFEELAFDHARDTRFPLDETHAALACSACHRRVALPNGSEVVRYRPLGTQCSDCHTVGGERR